MKLGTGRKKILVVLLAITTAASMQMTTFASDYEQHWAGQAIKEWVDYGIVKGYEDGQFKPNNKVTRAELATFLVQVFGVSGKKSPVGYLDVAEGAWYKEYVDQVTAMGWMQGKEGNFEPNQPATRQEMMVALARAYSLKGTTEVNFKDANQIAPEALSDITALIANGYIKGNPDGSLRPNDNLTRGEFVSILDRLTDNFIYKAGTYTGDRKGNVVINTPGVTLENMTIEGNLYLAPGIGKGEATLHQVTVKGQTFVEGGGVNTVLFNDCNFEQPVQVQSIDPVRIVSQGKACSLVTISGAHLILTGNFTNLEFLGDIGVEFRDAKAKQVIIQPTNAQLAQIADIKSTGTSDINLTAKAGITLHLQGDFRRLELLAGARTILKEVDLEQLIIMSLRDNPQAVTFIEADKASQIGQIEANAAATIQGEAKIKVLTINAEGVNSHIAAATNTVKEGIKAIISGKEVTKDTAKTVNTAPSSSGGGGGGGGTSPTTPEEKTYKLSYDLNGEKGTVPTVVIRKKGEIIRVAESIEVPAGKGLKEWNTQRDGKGTSYLPGSTLTMGTADIILYAIWENVEPITFDLYGVEDCWTDAVYNESEHRIGFVVKGDATKSVIDWTKLKYSTIRYTEWPKFEVCASGKLTSSYVLESDEKQGSGTYGVYVETNHKNGIFTYVEVRLTEDDEEIINHLWDDKAQEERITVEAGWIKGLVKRTIPEDGYEGKRLERENTFTIEDSSFDINTIKQICQYNSLFDWIKEEFDTEDSNRAKAITINKRFNHVILYKDEIDEEEFISIPKEGKRLAIEISHQGPFSVTIPPIDEWEDIIKIDKIEVTNPNLIKVFLTGEKEGLTKDDFELGVYAPGAENPRLQPSDLWEIKKDKENGSIYWISLEPDLTLQNGRVILSTKGIAIDPSAEEIDIPQEGDAVVSDWEALKAALDNTEIRNIIVTADIEISENTVFVEGKNISIQPNACLSVKEEVTLGIESFINNEGTFINKGHLDVPPTGAIAIIGNNAKVQGLGIIGEVDTDNEPIIIEEGIYRCKGDAWGLEVDLEDGATWEDVNFTLANSSVRVANLFVDVEIPTGKSVIIPTGKELVISEESELMITSGSVLELEGILVNRGSLNNEGTIEVTTGSMLVLMPGSSVKGLGKVDGVDTNEEVTVDDWVDGGEPIRGGEYILDSTDVWVRKE
ncbi:hypothetical protein CS063_12235 [Sporanaerobium hydrogeniformans]|uniref:Uncharacterized protein n=1 Tax=Sporanaerobium hydrogeniformans TaxID=3072179 RepID=A0AC61DBX4_9FIRM|nr:S-layer homology domain-containing protein [Sporanaerobium hydrogeniformans]PHV70067.1 hypothetical protein CS063_12235 [Sporanaerobium hydrogeniformans]